MTEPVLMLLVLYSQAVDQTQRFYERLGLVFQPEQHGNGPPHVAAIVGEVVLEIYPQAQAAGPLRLGFRVENVDALVASLSQAGMPVVSVPRLTPRGRLAVVQDPDGRRVELLETTTPAP